MGLRSGKLRLQVLIDRSTNRAQLQDLKSGDRECNLCFVLLLFWSLSMIGSVIGSGESLIGTHSESEFRLLQNKVRHACFEYSN